MTRRADPVPPTGTVTFLFSDIEGSTRLWETHQSAMQTAIARHDALIRQSIAARGGHIFKTIGDAFCAAFSTAPQALMAALSAQQVFHAEPWPESIPIRVRMALHTGAAEYRDGDYFGNPLNHVARLLAIAHGGQTLTSEITNDLCRDRLPVGASLKPLGEHGLKDIARREAVFQLSHPGLPSSFPPLRTTGTSPTFDDVPSIAVLPFVSLSGDAENEHFADGLAEELLNVLSKIHGLRVASRTSAFSFKGARVDIAAVAQKLNVATILEGSVRKAGKRVRITAQLVQVATDSHLWSETYDRDLDDIFAVQDDIAQSVVKELRATLLGDERSSLASAAVKAEVRAATKGRGENSEAHRYYLQGRSLVSRRTQGGVTTGMEHLRRAVGLDPEFALAWAALAYAQAIDAGTGGWTRFEEGYGHARDSANRALALEPDLAEGHMALAMIRWGYDWDWPGADLSIRRALALAPASADVLLAASYFASLQNQGEAIELCRRALALDPLNALGYRYLGQSLLWTGLLDEAEAALRRALELNPLGGITQASLGQVHLAQGRYFEARAAFEKESHEGFRLLGLAMAHHALGEKTASSTALEQLGELPAHAYLNAQANAYCGNPDEAFEWLEQAYKQRNAGLPSMKVQSSLRGLHDDPRWQPFLRKMGLAE